MYSYMYDLAAHMCYRKTLIKEINHQTTNLHSSRTIIIILKHIHFVHLIMCGLTGRMNAPSEQTFRLNKHSVLTNIPSQQTFRTNKRSVLTITSTLDRNTYHAVKFDVCDGKHQPNITVAPVCDPDRVPFLAPDR